ncbi:HAD-IIA family hydrolase [Saliphagus infecundisoli]|uniref:HAD-IIA family hydrolase n=1 Tax=Saliphagus infecundisoli TaxID=1849069 RepID=A0ABD5QCH5_9EURY|nr:HAD-IIA family hydrolase [Saliphagus infecundisoli]
MRGAVVDLDGTVYRSTVPVNGAVDGISELRSSGVDVLFVSNTSSKSRKTCVDRLDDMGIEASPDDIVTGASVTAAYVSESSPDATAFLVGEEPLREEFKRADVTLTDDPGTATVLVVGKDQSFDFDTLTAAARVLDEGAAFVATNLDRRSPTASGVVPGTGAIVAAVAATSGREPDIVAGKPHDPVIETTLWLLDLPPSACLMIGDNPETDVAMGKRAGMTTVLIESGLESSDVSATDGDGPDYVLETMASIGDVLDVEACG